jgi:hypothetical protein
MQQITDLIGRRFEAVHNARPSIEYPDYHWVGASPQAPKAALGVRFADQEALFLETYLDAPVEAVVSRVMKRPVSRERIVEIGCLAADHPVALMRLWLKTAAGLGQRDLVATATLTMPLQDMFKRIGIPLFRLAMADPARVPRAGDWGNYYRQAPAVYAGDVTSGAAALKRYAIRLGTLATGALA